MNELMQVIKIVRAAIADRRGVTAMEYGLIAALVAVVIIGAVTTMGEGLQKTFDKINKSLPS
jgi:pilus assembly protein Flp/PilA